jgi:hypothetical protein
MNPNATTVYDDKNYTELFADSIRVDHFDLWSRIVFIVTRKEDEGNGHISERRDVIGTVVIPADVRARIGRQLSADPHGQQRVDDILHGRLVVVQ